MTIPDTIDGLPVTSIGDFAFSYCERMTSITIPDSVMYIGVCAFLKCTSLTNIMFPNSVTYVGDASFRGCTSLSHVAIGSGVNNIGDTAFSRCSNLTAITVDAANASYSTLDGVLFNRSLTTLIQYPGGKTGSYIVPDSVTNIGSYAFMDCTRLQGVYFLTGSPSLGLEVFSGTSPIVYYLPGTTGWGPTFGYRTTALWVIPNPLVLKNSPSFGVQTNGFGFIISWATNRSVVVESSTVLSNPNWSPLATNTLVDGWSYFSDPQWTNHPARFYRIRSP